VILEHRLNSQLSNNDRQLQEVLKDVFFCFKMTHWIFLLGLKELFVYILDKRVVERKRETEKRKETLPCVEETTCWIVEWIGNDTKVNNAGMHPLSKHFLATTACVCVIWTGPAPATTKPSM